MLKKRKIVHKRDLQFCFVIRRLVTFWLFSLIIPISIMNCRNYIDGTLLRDVDEYPVHYDPAQSGS